MKKFICSIFIVFVIASQIFANDKTNNSEEDIVVWDGIPLKGSCTKNQFTVNQCAGIVFKTADEELNKLFQTQITYLNEMEKKWNGDGIPKKRLIEAQRAWIIFRDKDCAYQVGDGGSSEPFESSKCKYKRTMTRIEELKEYVDCRYNGCPY
jgi:uncharacterized protein YecT (DUF1311 family)